MQTWVQVYDPLDNLWISALIASIPVAFFAIALAVLRMKAPVVATLTVVLAVLVAVFFYGMPLPMALRSAGYGFVFGLWPIAWIIVAAVFLYKVAVRTGQFEVIRASVVMITEDQRLQVLLIGFSFGAFLEGAAGFGTPVAIASALLVGLGFNPLHAAGLCLIANTAPAAFGGMGIPVLVAGSVSGLDAFKIGAMAGRQLPLLSVFVPFWIVFVMDGLKGVRETWPAVLVAGGSLASTQFLTSNFIGYELPDVASALVSLVALTLFLKIWQPATVSRLGSGEVEAGPPAGCSAARAVKAWSPFLILTAVVGLWGSAGFKALFARGGALVATVLHFDIAGLDRLVIRSAPIVAEPTPYAAGYDLNLISATGTAILISAILSVLVLAMRPGEAIRTFGETVRELAVPIYTIGAMLALAFVANYSGLSSTLALVLAGTGAAYPFFSPVLGWLGVFLTGSDTSSNALFCGLQSNTAHQIGASDILMVAANGTGGGGGKMIAPQSIAVASAATGLVGREADLFRFTLWHSVLFVVIIGLITMLQAYVVPGMIP